MSTIKDTKIFNVVFFITLFVFLFCSLVLGDEIFMILSSIMIITFLFVDTISADNNNNNNNNNHY